MNLGKAGSSWGQVRGKVVAYDVSKREIVIAPDSGSTIVRMDGTKWKLLHLANKASGEFRFCVSSTSHIDWSKLRTGAYVSFDCKEQSDFSFSISNMSRK